MKAKKNKAVVIAGVILILMGGKINAQTYQSLNVVNGFDADLIANGTGAASTSTTQSVDDPANGYVFMSTDFVNGSGVSPTSGLPGNGLINSANTSGLSFQLAPYTSNNSLRLVNYNDSGTLAFNTSPKASKIYMLATTGSGSSNADIVVNFSDGSSQTFTNQEINDWYYGSSYAIWGIGRVSRVTDNIENSTDNPRLYEISLSINSVNQTKNISSISVAKTSSATGILCVFGFSYVAANNCIAPDILNTSNITVNSADISWNSIPGSASYEIYRSLSNTAPTNTTPTTVTGIPTNSTTLQNLAPATSYYVWVRTNCGSSTSDWSPASVNFTTLCGTINTPYTENFDSTAQGLLPNCTSSEDLTGTSAGIWSVADATGVAGFSSNALYTITSDQNNANTWFYTGGINLVAGNTYTLTFDYSNYNSPESFKISYGSSPVNSSMTNLIQDYPDINVGTSTPASVTFTPAVTGVYYLGFNVYTPASSGSFGIMLFDNLSLTQTNLGTVNTALTKNNINIYPNPATDYLYLRNNNKVTQISICDVTGKTVLSTDKVGDKIDISGLLRGNYFIVLKLTDGTSQSQKFIKK
ncbi:hypothetical protein ACM40_06490 [Chryseobacterium sp. BLS98]|uniref:T9SS type A sorting domain-containing protein n=1 Tax=Chryseobacterium sp. BLS98 TaxID=885586 RepID=UPI00065AF975|nr:T9SS type A sorting domain-containing protein [Chryseobacterium sp. BLS98]KMQ61964.1 hypothetical protein ACM40_06490 [Chryseobacterium sp. BLS98]